MISLLKKEEGFRGTVYKCTEGYDTIGYGTRLPITKDEGDLLLGHRLGKLKGEVDTELSHLHIEDDAWDVLYLMAYQMGVRGILRFKRMIEALEVQDYNKAAKEMLDSKWAKQTPLRASRMAQMMANV